MIHRGGRCATSTWKKTPFLGTFLTPDLVPDYALYPYPTAPSHPDQAEPLHSRACYDMRIEPKKQCELLSDESTMMINARQPCHQA